MAQAIELARSLGRLPGRLFVIGIQGGSFEANAVLGQSVAGAIAPAAGQVLDLLRGNY